MSREAAADQGALAPLLVALSDAREVSVPRAFAQVTEGVTVMGTELAAVLAFAIVATAFTLVSLIALF